MDILQKFNKSVSQSLKMNIKLSFLIEIVILVMSVGLVTICVNNFETDTYSKYIFIYSIFIITYSLCSDSAQNYVIADIKQTINKNNYDLRIISIITYLVGHLLCWTLYTEENEIYLLLLSIISSVPSFLAIGLAIGGFRKNNKISKSIVYNKLILVLIQLVIVLLIINKKTSLDLIETIFVLTAYPVVYIFASYIFVIDTRYFFLNGEKIVSLTKIGLPTFVGVLWNQLVFVIPYLMGNTNLETIKIASQFVNTGNIFVEYYNYVSLQNLRKKFNKYNFRSSVARARNKSRLLSLFGLIASCSALIVWMEIFEIKIKYSDVFNAVLIYFFFVSSRYFFGPVKNLLNVIGGHDYINKIEFMYMTIFFLIVIIFSVLIETGYNQLYTYLIAAGCLQYVIKFKFNIRLFKYAR